MISFPAFRPRLEWILILFIFVVGVLRSAAQDSTSSSQSQTSASSSEPSIVAAVRNSKTQKTAHAKKVFNDDDMEATAGPLPRLRMDGAENADEVVAAINTYKVSHTPQQTEDAVRIWYDRYNEILGAAIQENLDVRALRDANTSNGYELCQQSRDYVQCQNRQMAEVRGARNDQIQMSKNGNLEVRIQHAFMKVRNGLAQSNLRYDWFKIRTTNGIDQF